jgi:hypothetical protein
MFRRAGRCDITPRTAALTHYKSLTQKESTMPAILAFQTLPAQTATSHEARPALSISSCDSNSCR